MTKTPDYLGHDLGLGGFNTDAIDLTDVAEAERNGVAPPPLFLIVQASATTIGSKLTADGRRLKVTGPIVEGFRLDEDTGRKAIAAMRVQRRHAEDAAAGVANLPGFEGGEAPDVGVAHKVAGDGSVMTDDDVAEATGDPFAGADAAAKAALAEDGQDDGDATPRWIEDPDGFAEPTDDPGDGIAKTEAEGLEVTGDTLPPIGLAYVGWAWSTGNPLDADEAKVIESIDAQDDLALWEVDLLLELEARGAARDEVRFALSGRRNAELALRADEEPLAGFAKLKVGDVDDAVTNLVGVVTEESGEEDVLGALKAIDAIERFETTNKARAGVLKVLPPARAALLARLFPGAASS